MLRIVHYATHIDFYPKDENAGLSRKALLEIKDLSRKHEYTMHFYEEKCTYYTWAERISSNSEIKHIVDDIRRICKDVEMVFEIEKHYRGAPYSKIDIEEIDSLSGSITYAFFHGFNLDGLENSYSSSDHWELCVNGECKSHMIPEQLKNLPMNTKNAYIYSTKFNYKTGKEEIESREDGLDCKDWIKANKTWLDNIAADHKTQAEIYEAFRAADFRLKKDADSIFDYAEFCPHI